MTGRKPDAGTPRVEWLRVRLTPQESAAIDEARGELTRSAYVRALLAPPATTKRRKKP